MSEQIREAPVSGAAGFVSYSHDDNKRAQGRVLDIINRIQDEYGLITGEDLTVFTDRDLKWGENWRERIDTALQNTTFLIPIVTPRFFTSIECRKELLQFYSLAKSVGAPELIMPILFVDVEDLQEGSDDEAKSIIASAQYADWTTLRLKDASDPECLARVNELAKRLQEINVAFLSRPSVVPQEAVKGASDVDAEEEWFLSDEPGTADLIAETEAGMPAWTAAIEAFRSPNEIIAARVAAATQRLQEGEAAGKAFGFRIVVARELAEELMDPADDLRRVGIEYLEKLTALDPGVRAIIAAAGDSAFSEDDRQAACSMFLSLRELIAISRNSSESVVGLIESLKGPAKQFKDLRRPLGKMRSGLRGVIDGGAVFDEWERLLDGSTLVCSDVIGQ